MADVFVSYSRQDSPFVTRLAAAIESNGKNVWIDTSGIEDTEVFPLAIRSAIESSDAFLFVISPASVASRFCEQEVDYAHSLNKRLVPVLWDPVPDDELPEAIRERSWIPFEEETAFDGSLSRVMSALDADLEHRRSHTRWLTKAIEWDKEKRERSLLLRGSELRTAEAWLANTTERSDPAPTTLQREYVLAPPGRRQAQPDARIREPRRHAPCCRPARVRTDLAQSGDSRTSQGAACFNYFSGEQPRCRGRRPASPRRRAPSRP